MTPTETHWSLHLISTIFLAVDLTIRIGLSIRVIMRKRPYGVSLAWLVVILLIPFFGAFFYLLFGENRIPEKRTERIKKSFQHYQHWLKTLRDRAPIDWTTLKAEWFPLHHLAQSHTGLPAMAGNHLEILDTPERVIGAIIRDIDRATSTCHLQFYIWVEGGQVKQVIDALLRAAGRGVTCWILLDAIGSRDFLGSPTARLMKQAGICIRESLPAGIFTALFARIDIRNHRKIIVIDGSVAYTGSQNMADPYVYRQNIGVGNWIDVMVRIRGPVVESLAGTFINDWYLEAGLHRTRSLPFSDDDKTVRHLADVLSQPPAGNVAVQLVPSGPGFTADAIHSLLLTTVYAARQELILTTPYFIPDEALLTALKTAALRGVAVTVILPEKNESRLAAYATRARFEDLLKAGIRLKLFTGGFLHSKTITMDGSLALFGSVNLDMRSFWLNFETTLLIYDRGVSSQLRELQLRYAAGSYDIDPEEFARRSVLERFKENVVLLIGPLL